MHGWAVGMINTKTYFYHDKPLFGLDIGPSSIKVMQVDTNGGLASAKHKPEVIGYGSANFGLEAIKEGIVVKPKIIAEAAKKLFNSELIGDITTRRVALAIPAYRTFTRTLQLPKLKENEINEATHLEAEQYISTPIDELYMDYEVASLDVDKTETFFVAVPKIIVRSYLELAEILGLETVLIEPTLSSSGRLFANDPNSNIPTVIIDFGSLSADISIYSGRILATGTVPAGGEIFTAAIKTALNVTEPEAHLIKTKYGLGASKHQAEILKALEPTMTHLIKELRRMIRYYEEHYGNDHPIKQVITLGGGTNMPGLIDYLTSDLRIPVRHSDPWQFFNFKGLVPPSGADRPKYSTAAGLSIIKPGEIF